MITKDLIREMHERACWEVMREASRPQEKKLKLEVSANDAAFIVQMLTRRYRELDHKFTQYNDRWEGGIASDEDMNRRDHYQEEANKVKALIDYINDSLNLR